MGIFNEEGVEVLVDVVAMRLELCNDSRYLLANPKIGTLSSPVLRESIIARKTEMANEPV
jgi:hypothetical protein